MNSIFNFYFAFNFSLDGNRSTENRMATIENADEGIIHLDNGERQKVIQLVVDTVILI